MPDARDECFFEVFCPTCNCIDVNAADDPVVSHLPEHHNWYGQAHRVVVPMQCSTCKRMFTVRFSAYKERASVTIED